MTREEKIELIKKLVASGYTQARIAKLLGVTGALVSLWLKGKCKPDEKGDWYALLSAATQVNDENNAEKDVATMVVKTDKTYNVQEIQKEESEITKVKDSLRLQMDILMEEAETIRFSITSLESKLKNITDKIRVLETAQIALTHVQNMGVKK